MFPLYTGRSRYLSSDIFLARPRRRGSALLNSLIAHWRLDEASGTRVDVHGGNDLADLNSVGQASGKLGNAASFISVNEQSLAIADNAALSMSDIDFTIAGWVYFDSLPPAGLVGKWGPGSNLEYLVYFDGTNLRFCVSSNGSSAVFVANPQAISTAAWYFFLCRHDSVGNTIDISVNNNTAASVAHSAGVFDGTASLYLARNEDGFSWLDGRLDSVSLWKRLLTLAERTQLYNSGSGLDYPF